MLKLFALLALLCCFLTINAQTNYAQMCVFDFEKQILKASGCPSLTFDTVENKFNALGVVSKATSGLKGIVPYFQFIHGFVSLFGIVDDITKANGNSEKSAWQDAFNQLYDTLLKCMDIKLKEQDKITKKQKWADEANGFRAVMVKLKSSDPNTQTKGAEDLNILFQTAIEKDFSLWQDFDEKNNGHYYYYLFKVFKIAIEIKWWIATTHLSLLRGDPKSVDVFDKDYATAISNFKTLQKWAEHAYKKMYEFYYPDVSSISFDKYDWNDVNCFPGSSVRCKWSERLKFKSKALGSGYAICPTGSWGPYTCSATRRCPGGCSSAGTCHDIEIAKKLIISPSDTWFAKTKWTESIDDMVKKLEEIKQKPECTMKQISTATDGTTFGFDSDGLIYRKDGKSWVNINRCLGSVIDISVVSPTLIYVITNDNNNNRVYSNRRNGIWDWTEMKGFPNKKISVANDGTIYGISMNKKLYRKDGTSWTDISLNKGWIDVSVGTKTNYAAISDIGDIYINGKLLADTRKWKQISLASDMTMFGITTDSKIYRRDSDKWTYIWNLFDDISVGSSKVFYAITKYGDIFESNDNGKAGTALGQLKCSGACSSGITKGKYTMLKMGSRCPIGTHIKTADECGIAFGKLGLPTNPSWSTTTENSPNGCIYGHNNGVWNWGFNDYVGATKTQPGISPVCLVSSTLTKGKYSMLPVDSRCAIGTHITTSDECGIAFGKLGLPTNRPWSTTTENSPNGCIYGHNNGVWDIGFNTYVGWTKTQPGISPICLVSSALAKGKYAKLQSGSKPCESFSYFKQLSSIEECRIAHDTLGLARKKEFVGSADSSNAPYGCLHVDNNVANHPMDMAWARTHAIDPSISPICLLTSAFGDTNAGTLKQPYQLLDMGSKGCESDHQIKTIEDCRIAVSLLGLPTETGKEWRGESTDRPIGCQYDSGTSALGWNSATIGKAVATIRPICLITTTSNRRLLNYYAQ